MQDVELRLRRQDGELLIVMETATAVHNEAGQLAACRGIWRDVTEQRKVELQFLRAQRIETIGSLASGIAHDLNNVLAPIMMSVQILRDGTIDENQRRLMDTLEVSTNRAADMVKQVLTFARGVHGQRSPIQIRHVLKDVEKIIGDTVLRAVRVRSDIPRDLWIVNADGTQLHQLFMNLCVNVRDAMSGRGEISISARNTTITENRKRYGLELLPGTYVAVEVKDSGSGMPPELIEKIFEPFFTTKAAGKGTGLGLSTVQSIIRGHGGFVEVRTEVDRGTTFTVYLPSASSKIAEGAVVDRGALPLGNGEVVLIVDDEAAIRDIARATLEAYGYRVLAAANGDEGLQLLAQHGDEIQVIVSDMNMPGMKGDSMVRQMLRNQPELRIIATSGRLEREERGGLRKPYTAEELLRAINKALHKQTSSG